MRLVNLTVLPTGTTLAVITPTALVAVYGSTLLGGAVPFAILAVTIIFSRPEPSPDHYPASHR
jgi:hypothetical protein